ncbi:hypothetical protein K9M79_02900 [Candidatus Woesearchaeota archaeon]|nr:hypothetical protein [Candidatus Woesearchaeota archaeon]
MNGSDEIEMIEQEKEIDNYIDESYDRQKDDFVEQQYIERKEESEW